MDLSRTGLILVLVYNLELLFANFITPQRFPKLPGDILIDKPDFRFYIPFAAPLVISIILTYLLGSFLK